MPVSLIGLLITKGDGPVVAEWLEDQAKLYDQVICLDGSKDDDTAAIVSGYSDRVIYLHERDFRISAATDHGIRKVVHDEIVRRFGTDNWVMCCHVDEFCYHDPRKIAERADADGFDHVWWFSPHFYPHPSEREHWALRRLLPIRRRFRHYHWSHLGNQLPWTEHRLYRNGPEVRWDETTHGNVRPHGVDRPAPYLPILCHYKVTDDLLEKYQVQEAASLYREHWHDQVDRTGLPYAVESVDDLFVDKVRKYEICSRFSGKFEQPWNLGEKYRPDGAEASLGEGLSQEAAWLYPRVRKLAESERAQAIEAYQTLVSLECAPDLRVRALTDLAVLQATAGDATSARTGLQAALELDPQNHRAARTLEVLRGSVTRSVPMATVPRPTRGEEPSRRRIAILSLLFNWPSTGGGTVHTAELGRFLNRAGYEVLHLYARNLAWGVGRLDEPVDYPTRAVEFESRDWNSAAIRQRFREEVNSFAPESVIITDSWNFKPLLAKAVEDYPYYLRIAAQECLCPLNNVRLLYEQGRLAACPRHQFATPDICRQCVETRARNSGGLHQAERALSGFGTPEYQSQLIEAFGKAAGVLVVNPLIAEAVKPYARAVHVIPSGFDPERFPAPGSDIATARDRVRILFAGLPDELMKGFAVLHAACELLWRERQDFELIATGDPAEQVDQFTRFIGWQSQAELPSVMRDADIVAFPTVAEEALGRTAVEAMGAARPVVASRIGGLSFTVVDGLTGLLCEPGNPHDLASKLRTLMDDPALRQRMGRAGRARFESEYTWDVILHRHYFRLLGNPGVDVPSARHDSLPKPLPLASTH